MPTELNLRQNRYETLRSRWMVIFHTNILLDIASYLKFI